MIIFRTIWELDDLILNFFTFDLLYMYNHYIYILFFFVNSQSKKSYKNSGVVHLVHVDMYKSYSFLDYIRGGTELAATISIDFTGSNGNPRDPNSLHYIQYGGKLNQYEQAIKSVGEIIEGLYQFEQFQTSLNKIRQFWSSFDQI